MIPICVKFEKFNINLISGCGYVILNDKYLILTKELNMAVSYDRLWHLLIDRHMSKTELIHEAKISTNAMAHLGKNEDVRVEVLVKICKALNCSIEDIIEIIQE